MRTKIRIAIAGIGIFCALIVAIIIIMTNSRDINIHSGTTIKEETELNEYVMKYREDWKALITFFLKGNISYNEMPLSKKFRLKFKNLTDIIDGYCHGDYDDNIMNKYSEISNTLIVGVKTGKGSEDIAYKLHYTINENNELDDIEIIDSRVLIDENGNYPKYVFYHYYYDEPDIVTAMLCYPYVTVNNDKDYYRVYVTENFLKKFPDYLTIGVTGDTDYIMFGDSYCDKNNKNICYAEFLGLEWTKTYKLIYEIDDKGYINDIDIELYEKKKTENPEYVKNYYQEYLDNVDN